MIKREEMYFLSSEGKRRIKVYIWRAENPVGILQFSHGMKEHALRYQEMAEFFVERGFTVLGNDHLGHGRSTLSKGDTGYFGLPDGNKYLVEDLYRTFLLGKKEGDLPYFILGHSMGSFLLREFLLEYPKEKLNGAILMGTTEVAKPLLKAGIAYTSLTRKYIGEEYRSPVLKSIILNFNRKLARHHTPFDWISSIEEEVQHFAEDPLVQFDFTANGYHFLLEAMERMNPLKKEEANLAIPLFIVSGEEDPVGEFGKCPKITYQKYIQKGYTDVSLKLYPNNRHELLHDRDKEQVLEDLYQWMIERREEE